MMQSFLVENKFNLNLLRPQHVASCAASKHLKQLKKLKLDTHISTQKCGIKASIFQ